VSLHCFCLRGTNFVQIFFLFRKSSWRIWWIISLLVFNSPKIVLRAHQRSRVTISRTFAFVSAFREAEGRPLFGSSWRSSCPSLNRLIIQIHCYDLKFQHHRQLTTFNKFMLVFYLVQHVVPWKQLKTQLTH
jgi:hypothetical protein